MNFRHVSDACQDFLAQCLQRDPSKRIDFDGFFDHPFLDMEHVPTEESVPKAMKIIEKAVAKDKRGEMKEALTLYRYNRQNLFYSTFVLILGSIDGRCSGLNHRQFNPLDLISSRVPYHWATATPNFQSIEQTSWLFISDLHLSILYLTTKQRKTLSKESH